MYLRYPPRPVTSSATPATAGDQQVDSRRWLVSTLAAFNEKRGLISVYSWLPNNFESTIKKK
jgi:hypothetical protein